MSGLAGRVVEFAADQLPEPERSRRREEWGADLDGAVENGVSRAGVALGAMALALRSPLPSPAAAGWWAQWALAISAIGSVVWLSLWTSGLFYSNPGSRDSIEPLVAASTIVSLILVLLAGIRTRGVPWVASAALILVCLTSALWVIGVSWPIVLVPMLGLAVVALLVIGWRLNHAGVARGHTTAVFAFVSVPLLVVTTDAAGPAGQWVPIAAAVIAVVIALIVIARSSRSLAKATRAGRRGGLVVLATMSAFVIAVAASVTYSTRIAADPASGAWLSKLWTRLSPSVMFQTGATVVSVATLVALCVILAAVARRRQIRLSVDGLSLLVAAAIASVGSRLPFLGPWPSATSEALVIMIGLGGCLSAAIGIVLLVAPPRIRDERPIEVPVD